MKISTLAERDLVTVNLKAPNRNDAILEIIEALSSRRKLEFKRQVLTDLLNRECCGTTAIGNGIAIPHVRMPIVLHVDEAIVSLSFLARPIDFHAADGKPVTVLFTLVTPTVHGHLHLLAALAYLLRDEAFLAAVRSAAPGEVLLARAAEVERQSAGRRAAGGPA